MRTACWNSGILVLFIAASSNPLHGEAEKPGALEVEPEELQPGLVAHYRSLTDRQAKYELDRKTIKPGEDATVHEAAPKK